MVQGLGPPSGRYFYAFEDFAVYLMTALSVIALMALMARAVLMTLGLSSSFIFQPRIRVESLGLDVSMVSRYLQQAAGSLLLLANRDRN